MFSQKYRLTSKDVRYIQKQRNIIWTSHFGILSIPQYQNKSYHQHSIYIAADTVKKASWRHSLKRKLIELFKERVLLNHSVQRKYYKFFIFLNKKTVSPSLLGTNKQSRENYFSLLADNFIKEWDIVNKKLSL